jgi:hypothetical protein
MSKADSEDSSGILELATEAVAPIEEELRRRLDVEVGERDSLAIETALLKAFFNGMRTAIADAAETAEPFIEEAAGLGFGADPILLKPLPDRSLPWVDPWAARYGDDGK